MTNGHNRHFANTSSDRIVEELSLSGAWLGRFMMKKSRYVRLYGGSLDGVDFKVYQRRASYPRTRVDKQGWYTGAESGSLYDGGSGAGGEDVVGGGIRR